MTHLKRWTPELVEEAKRLFLEEKLTLQEIGDKYGVCRERVRQVIGNVFGYKVRRKLPKQIRHLTNNHSEQTKNVILRNRFYSQVKFDSETGCWIWTGTKNGKKCYGRMYLRCIPSDPDASVSPRKFAHFLKFGEYPKCNPRYSCGNNLCCNPEHEKHH